MRNREDGGGRFGRGGGGWGQLDMSFISLTILLSTLTLILREFNCMNTFLIQFKKVVQDFGLICNVH